MRHSSIKDELRNGNTITYYTVGVSMRPLLRERDTVVAIAPQAARKNDIVLYLRHGSAYVLHRLIKEDSDFYYMRGDNTYSLEPVEKSQALGVVTHIHRSDRVIDVRTNRAYKFYVSFWKFVYPVRYLLWKCRRLKRILKPRSSR